MKIPANKPFPEKYRALYDECFRDEKPLFIITGDLTFNRTYGESALCFTKTAVYAFDESFDGRMKKVEYSTLGKAKVKRMYGNATFDLYDRDGKRQVVMRLSFAAANVADLGADFINGII